MKQLLFMVAVLAAGLLGGLIHPFYAVLPYYLFSILQPQYLWHWALPEGVRWSLLAAVVAVLAVLLHARRVFQSVHWNGTLTLMCLYAGWVVLSCLTAFDASVAGRWLDVYGKILLMAVLTGMLVDSLEKIRLALAMVFVALAYLAWHFNSLYYFERRMDILFYGLGAWDNNGVALMMGMGVGLAYAHWRSVRSWWLQAGCLAAAVLMVHAVMLSYSRGAMLSGLVGLVFLGLSHRPRWQILPLGIATAVVILALAGPQVRERFFSVMDRPDASIQSRFQSWAAARQMIQDHPITGVGLRNSNIYSYNYGADTRWRTIHNVYLQVAADTGLPGLGLFGAVGLWGWWGLRSAKAQLRGRNRELRKILEESGGQMDAGAQRRREREAMEEAIRRNEGLSHFVVGWQGALVVYFFDGLFFSSEMIELYWLLIALAGAMPYAMERFLDRQEAELAEASGVDAAGGDGNGKGEAEERRRTADSGQKEADRHGRGERERTEVYRGRAKPAGARL